MGEHLDKQFNRVLLSMKDVEKSLAYFSAAEKSCALENRDAAARLIAAGIVAYARPFSGNKQHERAVSKRPPFPMASLSPEERDLRGRLIKKRNTVIAHSDAEMNSATTIEYSSSGFFEPGLQPDIRSV